MKHALALIIALSAAPALASDTEKKTEKDKQRGDQIVCKSTFVVNSKIPVRMCHTRDEWAIIQKDAQESRRRSSQLPSNCGDSFC